MLLKVAVTSYRRVPWYRKTVTRKMHCVLQKLMVCSLTSGVDETAINAKPEP